MTPLEEKLNNLVNRQEEHGKTLEKIHVAITGDKLLGHKGVIPTIQEHGERITKLEETNKKRWWFIIGASSGGGFVGGALGGPLIKTLFAKISSAILFLK